MSISRAGQPLAGKLGRAGWSKWPQHLQEQELKGGLLLCHGDNASATLRSSRPCSGSTRGHAQFENAVLDARTRARDEQTSPGRW